MVKTFGLTLLAGILVAGNAHALHDAEVTDAEFRCQAAVSKASATFLAAAGRCVSKCIAGARRMPPRNPEADCFSPFGGATLRCIEDPIKGAEAKAIAAIDKACVTLAGKTDCPECYAARGSEPDCSSHGNAMIIGGLVNPPSASLESYADAFLGFEFCNDGPNTAAENTCEQRLVKAIGKLVGCTYRCYDRCQAAMHRSAIPVGSCDPPAPSDATTFACLFDPFEGCEARALAAVDAACFAPGADAPECHDFTPSKVVSLIETWLDGNVPPIYCGSPSGAFLAD